MDPSIERKEYLFSQAQTAIQELLSLIQDKSQQWTSVPSTDEIVVDTYDEETFRASGQIPLSFPEALPLFFDRMDTETAYLRRVEVFERLSDEVDLVQVSVGLQVPTSVRIVYALRVRTILGNGCAVSVLWSIDKKWFRSPLLLEGIAGFVFPVGHLLEPNGNTCKMTTIVRGNDASVKSGNVHAAMMGMSIYVTTTRIKIMRKLALELQAVRPKSNSFQWKDLPCQIRVKLCEMLSRHSGWRPLSNTEEITIWRSINNPDQIAVLGLFMVKSPTFQVAKCMLESNCSCVGSSRISSEFVRIVDRLDCCSRVICKPFNPLQNHGIASGHLIKTDICVFQALVQDDNMFSLVEQSVDFDVSLTTGVIKRGNMLPSGVVITPTSQGELLTAVSFVTQFDFKSFIPNDSKENDGIKTEDKVQYKQHMERLLNPEYETELSDALMHHFFDWIEKFRHDSNPKTSIVQTQKSIVCTQSESMASDPNSLVDTSNQLPSAFTSSCQSNPLNFDGLSFAYSNKQSVTTLLGSHKCCEELKADDEYLVDPDLSNLDPQLDPQSKAQKVQTSGSILMDSQIGSIATMPNLQSRQTAPVLQIQDELKLEAGKQLTQMEIHVRLSQLRQSFHWLRSIASSKTRTGVAVWNWHQQAIEALSLLKQSLELNFCISAQKGSQIFEHKQKYDAMRMQLQSQYSNPNLNANFTSFNSLPRPPSYTFPFLNSSADAQAHPVYPPTQVIPLPLQVQRFPPFFKNNNSLPTVVPESLHAQSRNWRTEPTINANIANPTNPTNPTKTTKRKRETKLHTSAPNPAFSTPNQNSVPPVQMGVTMSASQAPSLVNSPGEKVRKPKKQRKKRWRFSKVDESELVCRSCGTTSTVKWRRSTFDLRILCNACGLSEKKKTRKRTNHHIIDAKPCETIPTNTND